MKILAVKIRAPLISSRSSPPDILPFQVAVIPPLPLPPTLIGAFLRSYCRLFPPTSTRNVDGSASHLLQDFLDAGFWATCGFDSEFSSLVKASVLLKRSRMLEGQDPEKSDAMIREYNFLPHWVIFFVLPENLCSSNKLKDDEIKQIGLLVDRVGDTESLVSPVETKLINCDPTTNSNIPLNTITPADFFEKIPVEGILWRGIRTTAFPKTSKSSQKKKVGTNASRDYLLPLTLRSEKGYEWYGLQPITGYQIKPECQIFSFSVFDMKVAMVYKPVS